VANFIVDYYISLDRLKQTLGKYRNNKLRIRGRFKSEKKSVAMHSPSP